ncbi:MAG TPA: HEAT repeat domain-containing protein [Acidimicrobiia bacterium]
MTEVGPDLDTARSRVVERGLTADAIRELTPVVSALPLDALGPVKQLLKQFFSDAAWTGDDDRALAEIVGTGSGGGRHELEPGLTLVWTWAEGRFRLRVETDAPQARGAPTGPGNATSTTDLGETFDGVVVPEATPSPRTIRFATPPLHDGAARNYDSFAAAADADARVARIFDAFETVTNVLLGPDFVAVTIARPDAWEELLEPILRAVTQEFVADTSPAAQSPPDAPTPARAAVREREAREPRRLERAWAELGALRADRPDDLTRILAARDDAEPARRQVAAALLADAPPEAAAGAWAALLVDSSRVVRRSTVDAIAGAERQELRPLLERALGDADAWIRWKALAGIGALGPEPSRAAIATVADDPDFRVRLEASRLGAA